MWGMGVGPKFVVRFLVGLASSTFIVFTFASVPAATASTAAGTAHKSSAPAVISGPARLTPALAAMVHCTRLAARGEALASHWTPAPKKAAQPGPQIPRVRSAARG